MTQGVPANLKVLSQGMNSIPKEHVEMTVKFANRRNIATWKFWMS